MNNLNLTSTLTELRKQADLDLMELILTINNLTISMLADEEIPDMIKPEIWGEVRKDTLTEAQFNSLMTPATRVSDWLRASFPEMVKVTFINNDRKSATPYEPKIAVYFEIKDDYMIIHPIGFTLANDGIFKCGKRANIDTCRKLTDRFVFFGPDAKYASCMSEEALSEMQKIDRGLWEYIDRVVEPLNLVLRKRYEEIHRRVEYQERSTVLAPVLGLAVAALNDLDKRKDMGRWLRKEYLRDKQVFNHACAILNIEVKTDGDSVVVRYL